jgi:hypothetical protein
VVDLASSGCAYVRRRPWQVWLKPYVESSIATVYVCAGMATYGPKWWATVAIGTWVLRWALLRAIWRHEDARDEATP